VQRIRYKETETKGLFESVQTFTSNKGGKYKAYYNINTMTYKIKNLTSGIYVSTTKKDGKNSPKTVNVLKIQLKRALKRIGVKFKLETRSLKW